MSKTEIKYIELCKKLLEQKLSFGNGHGYTQKDLELLSNYIEEQTGTSISLSTLKRLWKTNFKQGPQVATLNALVQSLGYSNWQDFKLENKEPATQKALSKTSKNGFKKGLMLGIGGIILVLVFFMFPQWNKATKSEEPIKITGPVSFTSNTTLTKGTPNTVIFNYDVSKIKADSFFIQQSWNTWRREKIDPKAQVFSSIYYEPGFHRAKLIANDSVISQLPIHILSDGWEVHAYYDTSDDRFINFKDISFIDDGILHVSKDMLLQKNIDINREFVTRVSHSKVYDVSSDNFNFIARAKLDANQLNTNCPWFNILIVTEKHIFSVGLKQKGCEIFASYKLGEIYKNGKTEDLSRLGIDIFDWHDIGFEVKDKTASILVDGQKAYTENFKEDFGKIVGITFIFEGTGSVDFVKLTDDKGAVAFEDGFTR